MRAVSKVLLPVMYSSYNKTPAVGRGENTRLKLIVLVYFDIV
jgi:hypothetical protein